MASERMPTCSGESAAPNVLPASLSASTSVSSEACETADVRRRMRKRMLVPARGDDAVSMADELASASSRAGLSSVAPEVAAESSSRGEYCGGGDDGALVVHHAGAWKAARQSRSVRRSNGVLDSSASSPRSVSSSPPGERDSLTVAARRRFVFDVLVPLLMWRVSAAGMAWKAVSSGMCIVGTPNRLALAFSHAPVTLPAMGCSLSRPGWTVGLSLAESHDDDADARWLSGVAGGRACAATGSPAGTSSASASGTAR